jgi:hypothetical protein
MPVGYLTAVYRAYKSFYLFKSRWADGRKEAPLKNSESIRAIEFKSINRFVRRRMFEGDIL